MKKKIVYKIVTKKVKNKKTGEISQKKIKRAYWEDGTPLNKEELLELKNKMGKKKEATQNKSIENEKVKLIKGFFHSKKKEMAIVVGILLTVVLGLYFLSGNNEEKTKIKPRTVIINEANVAIDENMKVNIGMELSEIKEKIRKLNESKLALVNESERLNRRMIELSKSGSQDADWKIEKLKNEKEEVDKKLIQIMKVEGINRRIKERKIQESINRSLPITEEKEKEVPEIETFKKLRMRSLSILDFWGMPSGFERTKIFRGNSSLKDYKGADVLLILRDKIPSKCKGVFNIKNFQKDININDAIMFEISSPSKTEKLFFLNSDGELYAFETSKIYKRQLNSLSQCRFDLKGELATKVEDLIKMFAVDLI